MDWLVVVAMLIPDCGMMPGDMLRDDPNDPERILWVRSIDRSILDIIPASALKLVCGDVNSPGGPGQRPIRERHPHLKLVG